MGNDLASAVVSRRTLALAAGAVALTPLSSGCQAAPAIVRAVFNPAVNNWLYQFGIALAATATVELGKDPEWRKAFWTLYEQWFPEREDNGCVTSVTQMSEGPGPLFLLVATRASTEPCKSESNRADPLNDGCGVVINKGEDGFHLPSWAWQSLAMFAHEITTDLSGADLERAKTLLQVSLAPTSSDTGRDQSWAKAVEFISYQTHMGPVDIARVENEDHTFSGLVKVSGFPDATGQATVWTYPIPTTLAKSS